MGLIRENIIFFNKLYSLKLAHPNSLDISFVDVDRDQDAAHGHLRRPKVQELRVVELELAELVGHVEDRAVKVIPQNPEIALHTRYWSWKVKIEFQLVEDLSL